MTESPGVPGAFLYPNNAYATECRQLRENKAHFLADIILQLDTKMISHVR